MKFIVLTDYFSKQPVLVNPAHIVTVNDDIGDKQKREHHARISTTNEGHLLVMESTEQVRLLAEQRLVEQSEPIVNMGVSVQQACTIYEEGIISLSPDESIQAKRK